MAEFFGVVPWFNSEEWFRVYQVISDDSANKTEALNLLLLWKARCPSLPSGIESTLNLLQVHVEDAKNILDEENDQFLRLAYSSAVMRFVNHMLDTQFAKGSSLYQAAKHVGVPEWIIDLRHDTAHNHNLPPLVLLRDACKISLQWLQENYWGKHKPFIKDYISGQKYMNNAEDNKIASLINFCFSLSICSISNIKRLSQIPNAAMQESIVNDAKDLLGDQIDLSNLKTVSLQSLINMMNTQASKILDVKDAATHVNNALLGPDSLFLSKELLRFFSNNEFKFKNKLNKNYVQSYEVLLTFLHTNDLLLSLITELIAITQSNENSFKSLLASLWVAEILLALKKSKLFMDKTDKLSAKTEKPKKKKDLIQLYKHWFLGDTSKQFYLDLQKPVPRELTDINFIQPLISTYNPYLNNFIQPLLDLIEPRLPKAVSERICTLAKLIASPDKFPMMSPSVIYTAEDLKTSMDVDDVQIIETNDNVAMEEPESQELTNSIWKLASTEYNWSTCPIGLVPWKCNFNVPNNNEEK